MKKAVYFTLLLCGFYSCSGEKLTPLSEVNEINPLVGKADVEFCTLPPTLIDQELKIIFGLDISGSNRIVHNGPDGSQRDPTDPQRVNRYQSLINWLNQRTNDNAEFYSLIEFGGTQATIAPGALASPDSPFVGRTEDFSTVVQTQRGATTDNGGTPYLTFFDTVKSLIETDAQNAVDEAEENETPLVVSRYVVILLSDGMPTDDNAPFNVIKNKVRDEIMTLPFTVNFGAAIESVNINTGYYYQNQDFPILRELLKEIASIGQGDAYTFDTNNGTIDYNQLTRVFFKRVATTLTDLIVENVNSIWDLDTISLQPDTDGDFLSDRYEKILGSDPKKWDSDENGVSDGTEALVGREGLPCKDPQCLPEFAFKFTGCFNNDVLKDILKDTDEDLVPDCMEDLYNTHKYKWNGSGSDIPDYLLLKFGLPATPADDINNPAPPIASVDSDFDGLDNQKEIKANTSPLVDNSSVEGLRPNIYKIKITSNNPLTQQTCYNVAVDDVTVFTGEDKIRVFLYENEKNQTGRQYLRIFEKRMIKGYAKITEDDEIIPKKPRN